MATTRKCFIPLAAAALLLASQAPASAQVIRIRKEITVEFPRDIRLGDIATVTGADRDTAQSLANTVILAGIDGDRNIRTESVLLALMSQRGAGALGNLQVTGSAQCTVKFAPTNPAADLALKNGPASSPLAEKPPPPSTTDPIITASVVPRAAENPAQSLTLSKLIAARVQKELNVPPDDVHILINTISPLLDAPVAPNRRWICRPMSRTILGTVQFESQLLEGSRIVEKLTVQARIERRQKVVIAIGRLERGDIVTAKNVRLDEAWLDRTMPSLFATDKDVVGLEAQRSIDVGSMLDQRDFKSALMASKNDAITVIYLSGALKVQMRGRAMEDGKLHDQIAVRNELTGERYQVVLIGKRLAVVGGTLDAAEEQKLREIQ
jgi:flagella basal body P-ring formation protein FlgA